MFLVELFVPSGYDPYFGVQKGFPNVNLQYWRKQHHLSQEELALLIDVDVRTIRRWEKNGAVPSEAHQEKLVELGYVESWTPVISLPGDYILENFEEARRLLLQDQFL